MFIVNMLAQDPTLWQNKVAVLTLDDGESTTAHIMYVDAEHNELIVDVLASNRSHPGSDHRAFTVSIGRVLSVCSAPSGMGPRRPLPPPDTCRMRQPFSLLHFVVLLLYVLTVAIGGAFLFILLADQPYGIQLASLPIDTAAVALYTFSATRGLQPYRLDCPVVRRQLPRLLQRHVGFLAALFILQTTALQVRPHLPAYWLTASGRDPSPFVTTLAIACICLGGAQIFSNRSLLDYAHLEFSSTDPAECSLPRP